MKKVMVVALVLCMLLPVISYAQVDLPSMTDMDLMQLQADLVDELFKRGKEATIPVGKYIVGPLHTSRRLCHHGWSVIWDMG